MALIEQKQAKITKRTQFFVSFLTFCGIPSPVTQVLATDIHKTALEVLTLADELKGTFEFTGANGPKTITNAQLVAALGSETDFKLRAWFVRSGYRSLNYDEVTVRKV